MSGSQLQCHPLSDLLGDWDCRWATPNSGVWDSCSGLPPPPVAHARGSLLPERPQCAEKDIPMSVYPSSSCLPQQWPLTSSVGPGLLSWSLDCGTLLPRPWHTIPSGCLHTANPSPLPRTDLQNLSLSAQPQPEHLPLWCLGAGVQMMCAVLTMLCPPQSSCCAFLCNLEVPWTWLIPLIRCLPRVWVPFLFHSSCSGMIVQSFFFFFLLFNQVMWRVYVLFGGLSSSASFQ